MKDENSDRAGNSGSACHYDWHACCEADKLPETRTILDRATDLYRMAEASAVKAIPAMRKLALPTAGLLVLAGLGVGTTLLYDPPAIREAATLASMEARAEPETVAAAPAAKPEETVIQGIPAPSTPKPVLAEAPGDAKAAVEKLAAADLAEDDAIPPELAYQPDRATMTGSIPAAVLEAAAKDLRRDKAASAAEPSVTSDDVADASARNGQIRTAVNMRASPDKDARVLAVVPAKASVDVIECNSWCKIAYEGQEGYVYKRYVR